MIGNDIVDLKLAATQSNWRRKGFLEKLFSEREQENILQCKFPELLVWRFWTMKESAYKAHQRRYNLAPRFNPRDFECETFSSEAGEVHIDSSVYKIFSEASAEYIYSKAIAENSIFKILSRLRNGISSEALKHDALEEFARLQRIERSVVEIQKCDYGIPFFSSKRHIFDTPVSFTHHGRFSAFSIAPDSPESKKMNLRKYHFPSFKGRRIKSFLLNISAS